MKVKLCRTFFLSLIVSLIAVYLTGCGRPATLEPEKFMPWIAKKESGLTQEKTVNHVTMRARFLPAEYLAYREYIVDRSASFDSLTKRYQCGLAFQFSLHADKADKRYGNLMQYNGTGDQEFLDRSQILSFNIQDFISMQLHDRVHVPVLAQYEGFNAINNTISFYVVFQIDEFSCGKGDEGFDDLTFTFNDPFWNLGKNNFLFKKNNILEMPKLKI